jgi:hypothetical protein
MVCCLFLGGIWYSSTDSEYPALDLSLNLKVYTIYKFVVANL